MRSACIVDRAVLLHPTDADAWSHRGNVLFQMKRFDEAAHDYERALSFAPDLPYCQGHLVQARLRCCDWKHIEEDREKIAAGLRVGRPVIDPFGNLIVSNSLEDQLQCARIAVADSGPANAACLWQGEHYQHDRIRVAYLSADFRPHPVAFLIAGVFEQHDKGRFEISGISFGPEDSSAMRARISSAFDRFIDVRSRRIDVAMLLRNGDRRRDRSHRFCEYGRPDFQPGPRRCR
jgi:predicted O-linked N-acetylglucosamine transferase (SPINDLY family)